MRRGMLAAALLTCVACGGGGSSSSPATVNGTIGGQGMGAQDAVSAVITVAPNSLGDILITNSPNTCAKLSAGQIPRNAKAIAFGLGTVSGTSISAPTVTATFTVYSQANIIGKTGNVGIARYQAIDANCNPVSDIEATSGTVVLTKVDSTGYAGTLDITFADSSHVTGSFSAARCNALETAPNITGTCV